MRYILYDSNFIGTHAFHIGKEMYHEAKPLTVIYGFLKSMMHTIRVESSIELIFCFDSPNGYRKRFDHTYKAIRLKDRTEKEIEDKEGIYFQLEQLRDYILPEMGFTNVHVQEGYEGDDLFGYFIQKYREDNFLMYTADEDLWQMLDTNRVIWESPLAKGKGVITEKLYRKMHDNLNPKQWAKVKAIAGKASEFSGVHGVGRVKAIQYINDKMGTHLKAYANIVNNKKLIKKNMILSKLPYRRGEIPLNLEIVDQPKLNWKRFKEILEEYGLYKIVDNSILDSWVKQIRNA